MSGDPRNFRRESQAADRSQAADVHGARLFASAPQMKGLIGGVIFAALLIGAEITHYVVATDLGALDRMEANADHDPQCKPLASKYDYSCPFPGYNTVQMICILNGQCGDRNLSMPPTTEAAYARSMSLEREDKIASLAVEAPYSGNNPEWRQAARSLKSGEEASVQPGRIEGAPKTLEEAQRVVWQRNLDLSQKDAEEWLEHHGR